MVEEQLTQRIWLIPGWLHDRHFRDEPLSTSGVLDLKYLVSPQY
jgi:hypothetical protein